MQEIGGGVGVIQPERLSIAVQSEVDGLQGVGVSVAPIKYSYSHTNPKKPPRDRTARRSNLRTNPVYRATRGVLNHQIVTKEYDRSCGGYYGLESVFTIAGET